MRYSTRNSGARRALIIAVALALSSIIGRAQSAVVSSPVATVVALHPELNSPISLRLPSVPADEHRDAAQRLFKRRRTGGLVWIIVGGAVFFRAFVSGASQGAVGPALIGGTVLGGIPALIGVGKVNRFSKTRENEALGAYDNAGTFPHYVEKRLD